MTEDLYATKDIQRIRELLLKEQQGLDLLTGLPIPNRQAVTDHKHDDEQLVRGILHRQCNAVLGKVENLWVRYLSYWYPNDLQTFLRQTADYLDREPDTRYRHPNYQKKLKTWYNALTARQQNDVLIKMGASEGANAAKRKELFSKVILDRKNSFVTIRDVILQAKEN